ncbi:dynein axonemal assembly factor 1 homolog [Atheta coriaria]|uniref:dynein axonemal assembly factor 1 homolog n=1 Tax=Dalotia coriaria TaxID=877792 RepID=UPI0031F4367F
MVRDKLDSEDPSRYPRMTKEFILKHCKEQKLYTTPYLNDVLYLHFKGFSTIENLEEYTGLKCLWLENNGIRQISGLDHQQNLRCLFLHNNIIKKIENLEALRILDTLNLSHNFVKKIENLSGLKQLHTLNLGHNHIENLEDFEDLVNYDELSCLDLSNNHIDEPLILQVVGKMKNLRVLNLMGNPVIRKVACYRKMMILSCKQLTYLDDRPVFPKDRACAEAWERGGVEEEKAERLRWSQREQQRIMDSVNGLIRIRDENIAKRQNRENLAIGEIGNQELVLPIEEEEGHENNEENEEGDLVPIRPGNYYEGLEERVQNREEQRERLEVNEEEYDYGRQGHEPEVNVEDEVENEDDDNCFMRDRNQDIDVSGYRECIFDFDPRSQRRYQREHNSRNLVQEIEEIDTPEVKITEKSEVIEEDVFDLMNFDLEGLFCEDSVEETKEVVKNDVKATKERLNAHKQDIYATMHQELDDYASNINEKLKNDEETSSVMFDKLSLLFEQGGLMQSGSSGVKVGENEENEEKIQQEEKKIELIEVINEEFSKLAINDLGNFKNEEKQEESEEQEEIQEEEGKEEENNDVEYLLKKKTDTNLKFLEKLANIDDFPQEMIDSLDKDKFLSECKARKIKISKEETNQYEEKEQEDEKVEIIDDINDYLPEELKISNEEPPLITETQKLNYNQYSQEENDFKAQMQWIPKKHDYLSQSLSRRTQKLQELHPDNTETKKEETEERGDQFYDKLDLQHKDAEFIFDSIDAEDTEDETLDPQILNREIINKSDEKPKPTHELPADDEIRDLLKWQLPKTTHQHVVLPPRRNKYRPEENFESGDQHFAKMLIKPEEKIKEPSLQNNIDQVSKQIVDQALEMASSSELSLISHEEKLKDEETNAYLAVTKISALRGDIKAYSESFDEFKKTFHVDYDALIQKYTQNLKKNPKLEEMFVEFKKKKHGGRLTPEDREYLIGLIERNKQVEEVEESEDNGYEIIEAPKTAICSLEMRLAKEED